MHGLDFWLLLVAVAFLLAVFAALYQSTTTILQLLSSNEAYAYQLDRLRLYNEQLLVSQLAAAKTARYRLEKERHKRFRQSYKLRQVIRPAAAPSVHEMQLARTAAIAYAASDVHRAEVLWRYRKMIHACRRAPAYPLP